MNLGNLRRKDPVTLVLVGIIVISSILSVIFGLIQVQKGKQTASQTSQDVQEEIASGQAEGEGQTSAAGEAADDEAAALEKKQITVEYEQIYDGMDEYAVLRGVDESRNEVWKITTDRYEAAQLSRTGAIEQLEDAFYYFEGGKIIALNPQDGSVLWENEEFVGSEADHCFDAEGNLYISGTLGPDLFVVDRNGHTIKRVNSFYPDYYWPREMELSGNELSITYDGTPSEERETIKVSILDWSSSMDKALEGNPMSVVSSIEATSFLDEPQYGVTHDAKKAIDGKLSTAWVENAKGNGIGESITIYLKETRLIAGLTIHPGYQKTDSLFKKNARPKKITIEFFDGSTLAAELQDSNSKQDIRFDTPVASDRLTIIIESVYEGSKYQDTAISEIELY